MARRRPMLLNSQEHIDIMASFERQHRFLRLDREKDRALWSKGYIYQDGEANRLFIAFRLGCAFAKAYYRE